MKVYTIYEIPGVKVGCDADWPLRAHEQNVDPNHCVILQQETDLIQVSIDEMWWQIELDYPVDLVPYFKVVEMNRKRASSGGKAAAKVNLESGQLHAFGRKYGKTNGQKNGRANVESGHLKSISSSGGKASGPKRVGLKWINNGIEETLIFPKDLEYMQNKGYILGRIKNK